jgi:VIT1/CCC1 family predicted Fe2+/Mn2+ transporter
VPVLPYLAGFASFVPAAIFAAAALFGLGVLVSLYTHRSPWYTGVRQLVLGAVAAAATYGIGTVVGTSVS